MAQIGEERVLSRGEVLGNSDVVFPLTTVVRLEDDEGKLLDWVDNQNAVGIPQIFALHDPSVATVTFTGSAVLAPNAEVRALFDGGGVFAAAMAYALVESLQASRLRALANLQSASRRVRQVLADLARFTAPGEPISASQEQLARWTGLQRTTVNGEIAKLRKAGAIRCMRTNILIVDPEIFASRTGLELDEIQADA